MSLPKIVFIREVTELDGSTYLLAEPLVIDAIEDDGPTMVGTYKLMNTRRLKRNPLPVEVERSR